MLKVTEQRMNCFMLIFRDLLTSIELTCWPWKNIVEREREGDEGNRNTTANVL